MVNANGWKVSGKRWGVAVGMGIQQQEILFYKKWDFLYWIVKDPIFRTRKTALIFNIKQQAVNFSIHVFSLNKLTWNYPYSAWSGVDGCPAHEY